MVPGSQRCAWLVLAATLGLAACATEVGVSKPGEGGDAAALKQAFTRFPDMPVPEGADINLDRTLVFGAGEDWFGRLVISVSHSASEMFDYFQRELPRFGWQEVTSVRSAVSVLTYARQDRVATIQIQGSRFRGSESIVTVSPKGRPEATLPPAGSGGFAPAPVQRTR